MPNITKVRAGGFDLRLEQEMKPSRTQLLLLIACLFLLAAPVLAQTSAMPSEAEVGGKLDAPLPDAPNPEPRVPPPSAGWAVRPTPTAGGMQIADKEFVVATGALFGSSVANVELTHRCLENGECSLVPRALVRRRALYGVGLPADAGITVLGYYLKRSGRKWWFVPAAIVTAGNTIYGIHAAQHMGR